MSNKNGFLGGCFGDCFDDNIIWIIIILIILFSCFCGNRDSSSSDC
ncbi:MAG TPA: hypothetical protein VIK78_15745 [Ruminiclostridium sp.]